MPPRAAGRIHPPRFRQWPDRSCRSRRAGRPARCRNRIAAPRGHGQWPAGMLSRRVEHWRDHLLAFSAELEAMLDFADEDDVQRGRPHRPGRPRAGARAGTRRGARPRHRPNPCAKVSGWRWRGRPMRANPPCSMPWSKAKRRLPRRWRAPPAMCWCAGGDRWRAVHAGRHGRAARRQRAMRSRRSALPAPRARLPAPIWCCGLARKAKARRGRGKWRRNATGRAISPKQRLHQRISALTGEGIAALQAGAGRSRAGAIAAPGRAGA